MNPALKGIISMMAPVPPGTAHAMLTYGAMLRRRGQAQVAMCLGVHDGTAQGWLMMLMTPGEPNVIVVLPVEVAEKWEAT